MCIPIPTTHDDEVSRELVLLLQGVEHEGEEVLRVRRVVGELDGRALEGGLDRGDGVHEEGQAALDLFVAEERERASVARRTNITDPIASSDTGYGGQSCYSDIFW